MRCFETVGCGALLLSDEGHYPAGMETAKTIFTYASSHDAIQKIDRLLSDPVNRIAIARRGHEMLASKYSKQHQWQAFLELLG